MKYGVFIKTAAWVLVLLVTAFGLPMQGLAAEQTSEQPSASWAVSPFAEAFSREDINPEYLEWLENGQKGKQPAAQILTQTASVPQYDAGGQRLPTAYDAREEGLVLATPNQGSAGTCWAFAETAALAGDLQEQFPGTQFSVSHMTWFGTTGKQEDLVFGQDDPFMRGGNANVAVGYYSAWKGPVSESVLPYDDTNHGPFDEELRDGAEFHVQDAEYMYWEEADVPSASERQQIKQRLLEHGPIELGYASSVAEGVAGNYEAYYSGGRSTLDHAVLLIGWDDNYSKENFNANLRPKRNGAWLVRNSWGEGLGDDGCMWISYEEPVDFGPDFNIEDTDNYQRNYQYDPAGCQFVFSTQEAKFASTETFANLFVAEETEMLEAVSFYTTDSNVPYQISVYTGCEADQPQSGQLVLKQQTGTMKATGYHTVALDTPVAVTKGQRFSVVITLTNPTVDEVIACEGTLFSEEEDYTPLGAGGQSFVLSDGQWEDVAGTIPLDDEWELYVSNVCIKAFTNPIPESGQMIPRVDFSQLEGPLASGDVVELTTVEGYEIWYTVDEHTAAQRYTQPIEMDFSQKASVTLQAYAVKNGQAGNVTPKTYTKATAGLTDLAIGSPGNWQHIDVSEQEIPTIFVSADTQIVQIQAQSTDTVWLNGTRLLSNQESDPIDLEPGAFTYLTVTVQGDGKNDAVYSLQVYRSALTFDYQAETVHYDDTLFALTDANQHSVADGSSITGLISTEQETTVFLTRLSTGAVTEEQIPKRPSLSEVGIDFLEETTAEAFSANYSYSENADMSRATRCHDDVIGLTPGQDIYIRRQATDAEFQGEIYRLTVPERPAAPTQESIVYEQTNNQCVYLYLQEGEGEYRLQGQQAFSDDGYFGHLKPNADATFEVRYAATQQSFASSVTWLTVNTTLVPVTPEDYSFTVHFTNQDDQSVLESVTVVFEETGDFMSDQVPLPAGYTLQTEGNRSINQLRMVNGVWQMLYEEVYLSVVSVAVPGDVNTDGRVDAKDALAVLKYAVGTQTLTDFQFDLADINQDQMADAKDALAILKIAVA